MPRRVQEFAIALEFISSQQQPSTLNIRALGARKGLRPHCLARLRQPSDLHLAFSKYSMLSKNRILATQRRGSEWMVGFRGQSLPIFAPLLMIDVLRGDVNTVHEGRFAMSYDSFCRIFRRA